MRERNKTERKRVVWGKGGGRANAAMFGELIFASSVIPPARESGPIGSTLHSISSLESPTAGSKSLLASAISDWLVCRVRPP